MIGAPPPGPVHVSDCGSFGRSVREAVCPSLTRLCSWTRNLDDSDISLDQASQKGTQQQPTPRGRQPPPLPSRGGYRGPSLTRLWRGPRCTFSGPVRLTSESSRHPSHPDFRVIQTHVQHRDDCCWPVVTTRTWTNKSDVERVSWCIQVSYTMVYALSLSDVRYHIH